MLLPSVQSIRLFVLFLGTFAVSIRAQCITPYDLISNKTTIGIAARNLEDGNLEFSLNMLRVLHMARIKEMELARGEIELAHREMELALGEGDGAGIFRSLAPGSWLPLLDGLDYEQRTTAGSENLFFSPYSVWSSLMVVYMGARRVTEAELRRVLGLDIDKITAWEAFRIIRNQSSQTEHSRYQAANMVFFQKGTIFKDCMREMLGNEIAFLDFKKKPALSTDAINAWVEEQTRQKIKDLIPADGINAQSRLVIANAVYFKKNWLHQFDPKLTQRRRFTISRTKETFAIMMKISGRFLYGTSEVLQCYAVELPYSGNDLSMVILLPQNRFYGVTILVNNLTPHRLKNVLDDLYPREVNVSIPKFKIEDSFELDSVLSKMGLRTLFNAKLADLSAFTGQREFDIDAIYHKVSIVVNEEGTEVVDAASVITSITAGPAVFIADYPFVFFIRDNLSHHILFLGTVLNPP